MIYCIKLISFFSLVKLITGEMGPHIVGGKKAKIKDFPHAVSLTLICPEIRNTRYCCGASILNQRILLTAAHCYKMCPLIRSYAVAGQENRFIGTAIDVKSYKVHEQFNINNNYANDIALAYLEFPLKLGSKISRVMIPKKPPHEEMAMVAGWGYLSDNGTPSMYLMYIPQRVKSRKSCKAKVPNLSKGAFCGYLKGTHYVVYGDSGSALMVRKYIQIGIASYKSKIAGRSFTVYTDVSYFYDWIKRNSKELYCDNKCKNLFDNK